MKEFLAILFEDDNQAEIVRLGLHKLRKEYLPDLEDAVVIRSLKGGDLRLTSSSVRNSDGHFTQDFLSYLVKLLMLQPAFAQKDADGSEVASQSLAEAGIEEGFVEQLKEGLAPPSSALCILSSSSDIPRILKELAPFEGRVLRTKLSNEGIHNIAKAIESVLATQQGAGDLENGRGQIDPITGGLLFY